ncbi:MAG: hypothetical protein V7746_11360 [Halioglobus sp.]
MKLFIHIGFHKTGSSAIQVHLGLNDAVLRHLGILVPRAGWSAGSGHNGFISRDSDELLVEMSQEMDKFSASGGHTAVLSFEGFTLFDAETIEKFARYFAKHEVVLVAYLREQSELIQSAFLERVKGGGRHKSLADFAPDKPLSFPHYLNIHSVIKKWHEGFARELTVITKIYDTADLVDNDAAADFLTLLGVDDLSGFEFLRKQQNTSLDVPSLALLNLLDALSSEFPSRGLLVDALLVNIAENGMGPRYFLHATQVDAVREHYAPSNQQVLEQYRPVNCSEPDRLQLFRFRPAAAGATAEPVTELLPRVTQIISHLKSVFLWRGKVLKAHALKRIAAGDDHGWYQSTFKGTWSRGDCSTLTFHLPVSRLNAGGGLIYLAFKGHYAKGFSATSVSCGEMTEQRCNLSDFVLRIPKDAADTRGRFVLSLEHIADESGQEAEALTELSRVFHLEELSYTMG